jgi:hypothetical protein
MLQKISANINSYSTIKLTSNKPVNYTSIQKIAEIKHIKINLPYYTKNIRT